ncbi:hypothetical protein REPUB_Repub03eG0124800 [Reevesia pubescens]
MASHVGRVVHLDRNTNEALGCLYASICVELDITKALLSKIRIGKQLKNVEYEGLNLICFQCGKVGHKKENCPSVVLVPSPVDPSVSMAD